MADAATPLPERARAVVVGGGVIGTSVAYHLTQRGWDDVLLLEQGRLSCGTTWHAAGLVGQLRASESGTRLVQYSTALYERLEDETGLSTGFRRHGGMIVARTPDRLVQLRRTAANAEAYALDCVLLDPQQAGERWPLMRTDDLLGALWLPGDGVANPTDLTLALAKGARLGGARVVEQVRVLDVLTAAGAVAGVRTDRGDVAADVVVVCAGQWANELCRRVGVTVPLHPAEHFYVVTDPIDGVRPDLPILRDPDGWTYVKEEVGGLVVGAFEPHARAWVAPDAIPYPFEFRLLGEDWEHFAPVLAEAVHRIPALEHAGLRKLYDGPESFTPDNQFVMGEAPGVPGLFVGAGFNSVGIASAGGAGRALAAWVVDGEPDGDLTAVDLRRFAAFHGDPDWLRERVVEVLGQHYAVPWPNREPETGRDLRRSPVHERLAARGAVFGTKMGWERPNVFAPKGQEPVIEYTWDRPTWLPWSVAEQRATREAVAVFDQTSFTKIEVAGSGALGHLQWLCANDVDVPVARAVYTALLNARGTFESDLTVTRTGPATFLVVSSSATTERDLDLLRRTLRPGDEVTVTDVTSASAVLGVMGPRSAALLGRLSGDLDPADWAFGESRDVRVGTSSCRATRITYVGEPGWELYVPAEQALRVHDDLTDAGRDLGRVDAGYYALDALRLEKGYRAFPRDVNPDLSPVEAGLLFACAFDGPDFLGRAAVEKARAEGVRRRLVSFVVGSPEPMLWGGELVRRDGVAVGQVTSAAWGATVGAAVGLALVADPSGTTTRAWAADGAYEVDVAGTRWPCTVTLRAPLA